MPDSAGLPDAKERCLARALAAHEEGSLEAAEAIYEGLLEEDPRCLPAAQGLGVIYNQRGTFDQGLVQLREALRLNPRSATTHLNLGVALRGLERASEAMMHVQYYEALCPGSSEGAFHRALTHLALVEPAEAIAAVETWMQKHPGFIEGPLHLGRIYQALGQFGKAAACYDEALVIDPTRVEVIQHRIQAWVGLGSLQEAYEAVGQLFHVGVCAQQELAAILVNLNLKCQQRVASLRAQIRQGRYDAARAQVAEWLVALDGRFEVVAALVSLESWQKHEAPICTLVRAWDLAVPGHPLRLGSAVLSILERGWAERSPWGPGEGCASSFESAMAEAWIPDLVHPVSETEGLAILAAYWDDEVVGFPEKSVTYQDELMMLFAGDLGDHEGAKRMARVYHKELRRHAQANPDLEQIQVVGGDFLGMIGHTGLLDLHLKARELGWSEASRIQVLMDPGQFIANPAFFDGFKHGLEIVTEAEQPEHLPFQRIFVNSSFEVEGRLVWWPERLSQVINRWEEEGRLPLARLDPTAEAEGESLSRELGLPEGAWYVTLHARDGSYRVDAGFDFRNTSWEALLPAARAIVQAGGWVVRVGDARAPLEEEPGFIDYAMSPLRSALMDVYLPAHARFFLGTSSGLVMVPMAFSIPSVQVNVAPMAARAYGPQDLFLPKLCRERISGRLLPIPEAMRSPTAKAFQDRLFEEAGLEAVANTAEEVAEVVKEMLSRLNGEEVDSPDDAELQRRFNHAYPDTWGGLGGRVGKAFLRRYQHLL